MRPPIDHDLHEAVGFLVARLFRGLHETFSRALAEHDATPPHWAVLLSLYQERAESPGELARYLAVDPGFVSRLVERLVEEGFVERRPGADRRSVSLRITPAGEELTRRLARVARTLDRELLASLEGDEVRRFKSTLHKLLDRVGPPGSNHRE